MPSSTNIDANLDNPRLRNSQWTVPHLVGINIPSAVDFVGSPEAILKNTAWSVEMYFKLI